LSLLIIIVGIALLTVPALAVRGQVGPAARVRTACLAVTAGIWAVGIGTLFTALPLVVVWHDGQQASGSELSHLAPGGQLAWAAGAVAAGLGATWLVDSVHRVSATRRRATLPRWAAESVRHDDETEAEVRVAPSDRPMAFAVPGRDRHIVVTRTVMQALTEAEFRAVLAHEDAHLQLRHDRYLAILATYHRIWGWLPGVAAVVASLRLAVEEWADARVLERGLSPEILLSARSRLAPEHHRPPVPPTAVSRSMWQLSGLTFALFGLVASAGYLATHTVTDMAAILTAIH